MNTEAAILDLKNQSFFVWDDFLSESEVRAVMLDYQTLYDRGAFRMAGIGQIENSHNQTQSIRRDETYWLDPLALTSVQKIFWERLEKLKNQINEQLLLGLWTLEGHYSYYPINGFYHRHLDRFKGNDQRTISMVLYFNSLWVEGDGGELRVHAGLGIPEVLDVAPMGGRLVCFLSAEVSHEVLVSNQLRASFAGWWKRRA